MATILITGGSGFIGRKLTERLGADHVVSAPGRAELDLLDPDAVRAYLRGGVFDVVVHAATWDATVTSQRSPELVLENNLRMFHHLTRDRDVFGRLINLGSGAEYDRGRDLDRVTETAFGEAVPSDQYGFSKYLARMFCEATPRFVNLSLFGVFGPGEDWRLRYLSNACCHALAGLPIEVGRDAAFDYLPVGDVAEAVAWVAGHEVEARSYNVCSGRPRSLSSLAELVRDVSGGDVSVEVLSTGGRSYVGDPTRFMALSGWTPSRLETAVAELYSWYEVHAVDIDREALLRRAWLRPETLEH
jgi:UDP-glucose 4-epimerase